MVITTYAKVIWEDFVSLVFPRVCLNCKEVLLKNEEYVCTNCRVGLPVTNYHLDPLNPIFQKFVSVPKVNFASTFLHFHKAGIAQHLLHALKYGGNFEIGEKLGEWFGEHVRDSIGTYDLIIPVPIHKNKIRSRGYNQSDAIASGLSRSLDIKTDAGVVSRIRETTTQTKKSKVERWKNVEKIFSVSDPDQLVDKSVIVVDDVITTGATTCSLCLELENAGVGNISVLAVASGK